MSARYRGILFDLDGTLVDSIDLILASYRHTMETHLGHVPPDEEWTSTLGMPLRVQLKSFAATAEQAESMFRTYIEHNQANHERLIRPFPGMQDAAVALRSAGYRLGIVTSKLYENAVRELIACGLLGLFDCLVSATDVRCPKPDPEPVLLGLRNLDLRAADALLVGDSLYDLLAGRAAGVDTAAALWGPFDRGRLAAGRPDHWLENIDELLALLNVESLEGKRG
ncbi:MAG: HAD-IA family hydrolase [Gemmatimonadales bacterium]